MTFEEQVREQLSLTPMSDTTRRSVLKVVLGELQRKPVSQKTSDETGHKIVKGMIESNNEMMGYLEPDSARFLACETENEVLQSLLPAYWDYSQVEDALRTVLESLQGAKNEGQAIGVAMRHLKSLSAPVEGELVRKVVQGLRS